MPSSAFRIGPIASIPLRWVLVVPFVLQTVAVVGLVGYFSYRSGQQAVADLSHQLMDEVGDRTTLYLKKTLETPHLINQLNADAIRLGQLPSFETQDPAPLETFFWNQLQRFPSVATIAIANERGGMVGSGRFLQPSRTVIYHTPQFAQGALLSSKLDGGGNRLDRRVVAANYDARTRPWYQTPAQTGRATWSPIYEFINFNRSLGISAGLPIYSASGALRGILATDITLDQLNQFLADEPISPTGQVFILERSGLLVASSTPQPLLRAQSESFHRLPARQAMDPITRATATQVEARFGNLSQIQTPQQFEMTQTPSQQWVRVIPFRDTYGLDWLIVLVVPESDWMAEIRTNQQRTLLLCGLTFLITTALGMLTAAWIAGPILKLNQSSRALAEGVWRQPLPATTPITELRSLTQSFNQTAVHLQQSLKQVRTALQESEGKFTTVFRTSPDPISINSVADGGCYLEVNDSFLKLTEYTREEVLGRSPQELGICIVLSQDTAIWYQLQTEGKVEGLELNYCTKSGRRGTVLLSIGLIELEGKPAFLKVGKDISDRKAAETALRQREAELQLITDSIPGCIAYTDAEQRYRFVNHTYERWFQCNREDILGKTIREVIGDRAYRSVQFYVERALAGETVHYEARVPYEGKTRDISAILLPDRDDQQQVKGYYALITDISDRKQIEIQLQKTERWLQQYSRQAPGPIYTLVQNPDGHVWFEYLSSAVETIHELSQVQVMSDARCLFEQIHPEDRAGYEAAVANSAEKLELFSYEWRILTPSGKSKWLLAKSQPERRENGAIVWHGVVQDITDRKQTEQALRRSEEMLRLLTDALPVFLSYVDREERYQFVNRAYEAQFGLPREQILGHPVRDIIGEVAYAQSAPYIQRALAGESLRYEITIPQPQQGDRYLSVILVPDLDATQQARGYYTLVIDLTERRQLELQLQDTQQALQDILDNAIAAITRFRVFADGTWEYEYRSGGSEAVFGYSSEEFLQNPRLWESRVPLEDQAIASIDFRLEDIFAERTFSSEYRFWHKDGSLRWIANTFTARHDPEGNYWVVTGVGTDITERKYMEQILQERDALLQAFNHNLELLVQERSEQLALVLSAAKLGTWQWQVGSDRQVWSPENYALLGFQTDASGQVLDHHGQVVAPYPSYELFLSRVHPEDHGKLLNHGQVPTLQSSEGRSLHDLEYRVIWSDGSIHWLQSRGTLVCNAEGQPLRWAGVSMNITDRKQSEEQIRASLHEKEVLLSEIHHRVKNNLQIICSLVRLQSNRVKDPTLTELLRETQDRVQSMALIHEMLYQSPNFAAINLLHYLTVLTKQLLRSYGAMSRGITSIVEGEPILLSIDQSIPCGLIVNELVSNALKHAFPAGTTGSIQVFLQRGEAPNQVLLTVQDNGVGLPAGVDWKTADSLGLQIVQGLVYQIDGQAVCDFWQHEGDRPSGTRFSIRFSNLHSAVSGDES